MSKTIWNPGDIITTEKWNRINNNTSLMLGAYQLSIEIGDPFEQGRVISNNSSFLNNNEITINKSFEEITGLLKQGVICYFYYQPEQDYSFITLATNFTGYDDNNGSIAFFDYYSNSTITFYSSYENSNIMINYDDYDYSEQESYPTR